MPKRYWIGLSFLIVSAVTAIIWVWLKWEHTMESRGADIQWEPYAPFALERLSRKRIRDNCSNRRMNLKLTFRTPRDGGKLQDSILLIESWDDECGGILYQGPFREQITLRSIPYAKEWVTLVFWAFHEESRTSVSWISQNTWPIFTGKPLLIELHDGHREEDAGWYAVHTAPSAR